MKIQTLLPSILSGTIIIRAFVFLYCYLNELWVASIILYVAALSTDYMDGILARKLDATLNYGAYLDTFADFTDYNHLHRICCGRNLSLLDLDTAHLHVPPVRPNIREQKPI